MKQKFPLFSFFCMITLSILVGCAPKPKKPEGDILLEKLTDFAIALNSNNFSEAIALLTPEEQEKFLTDGKLTTETQLSLKALRLPKLLRSPSLKLVRNQISGIHALLPRIGAVETDPSLLEQLPHSEEPAPVEKNPSTNFNSNSTSAPTTENLPSGVEVIKTKNPPADYFQEVAPPEPLPPVQTQSKPTTSKKKSTKKKTSLPPPKPTPPSSDVISDPGIIPLDAPSTDLQTIPQDPPETIPQNSVPPTSTYTEKPNPERVTPPSLEPSDPPIQAPLKSSSKASSSFSSTPASSDSAEPPATPAKEPSIESSPESEDDPFVDWGDPSQ